MVKHELQVMTLSPCSVPVVSIAVILWVLRLSPCMHFLIPRLTFLILNAMIICHSSKRQLNLFHFCIPWAVTCGIFSLAPLSSLYYYFKCFAQTSEMMTSHMQKRYIFFCLSWVVFSVIGPSCLWFRC